MKIYTLLAIASGAVAFSTKAAITRVGSRTTTTLFYIPPEFERAVECAEHNGMCNVDELSDLVEDLEKHQMTCFFGENCEKEVEGHKDLITILQLQRDLQLKEQDLNENLFVQEVDEMHCQQQRDRYLKLAPFFQW